MWCRVLPDGCVLFVCNLQVRISVTEALHILLMDTVICQKKYSTSPHLEDEEGKSRGISLKSLQERFERFLPA